MVSKNAPLPESALGWGLAVLLFVIVVSAPGIVYAILEERRRSVALTWVIAVEAVLVVGVGLYLRGRTRS